MENCCVEKDADKVEIVIIAIKRLSAQSGTHEDICDREMGYLKKAKNRRGKLNSEKLFFCRFWFA